MKLLFGADYRINNTSLVRTAITLGRSETELADNRGNADSSAINWTLFGLHQINERWAVNGTLMLQNTDYDNTRKIAINLPPLVSNYSLSAESSAQQTGLLVGSDYQWSLPHAFELSLLNQINAVRTETDTYSEAGINDFAQLSSVFGYEHYSNTTVSIGLRGEF